MKPFILETMGTIQRSKCSKATVNRIFEIIIHLAFSKSTIDRIFEIVIIHNNNNTLNFQRGDY